jgi:hypothetical protein
MTYITSCTNNYYSTLYVDICQKLLFLSVFLLFYPVVFFFVYLMFTQIR